ncbi:unnamed protein product [Nippostrongylus brasiliensis]|uniref:Saposin B-type domain-containing protein n=1 Tax=Nippostrongylus brasiliensis TaxID=27835 RepID=A0A0N4Y3T4_NIPBR|nr:unnamed protein product [Nippostrongylus brasiliensis]
MASPMRCIVLIAALFVATTSAQESTCNYVGLVKCFIKILDEWAWTLYELKDNVVTITSDQCVHLRELDKCIKDSVKKCTKLPINFLHLLLNNSFRKVKLLDLYRLVEVRDMLSVLNLIL